MISSTTASPSLNRIGGSVSAKQRRRRRTQVCWPCESGRSNLNSSRRMPAALSLSRDYYVVVTLSITVFLLVCCCTMKEAPTLLLVTAFVQNGDATGRSSLAQWNTISHHQHHHHSLLSSPMIKTRLTPTSSSSSYLSAKKEDGNESSSEDGKEESSLGSFFKRYNIDDDDDADKVDKISESEGGGGDRKSKGSIPIVGRFFSSDEEKQEKKKKNKKQKEDDDDGEREKIIPSVKSYFRERQVRKEAEAQEKQLEQDAEELRLEVQQRDQERKRQLTELQRKVSLKKKSSSSSATTKTPQSDEKTIAQRKIKTQKEMDKKRKERLEKVREARRSGVESVKPKKKFFQKNEEKDDDDDGGDDDDKNSKTQRFGNAVGAAQKYVSGMFDGGDDDDDDDKNSKTQRFGSAVGAAQKFVSSVFDNQNKKAEEWIVLAPKTRISPGEIVAVTAAGIDLLLIASKDGSAVHCVANSCPHLGTPLEVGSLERLPIESSKSSSTSTSNSTVAATTKSNDVKPIMKDSAFFQETDIAQMLKQDGCEECIVCPLHKTAFALESGEVRGEWCPYPPVIGKLTGALVKQSNLPIFDVRTKGKNIEVRLNTPVEISDDS